MKIKSFIIIFLTLLIKIGVAQSWIYVTNTADDAKIYISEESHYRPTSIKIWVKKTEGKIINDKNGVEVIPDGATISLVEFDCLNQQFRIHSVGDLDSNGNIVDQIELSGYKNPWFPVIPDSVFEKVLKKACDSSN